jgi:hypothetical protein
MNVDRGEILITLDGVELSLVFRARAMQVLAEITGQSPFKFLQRLQGIDVDDVESIVSVTCDYAFVVPLIMAGLATHPKHGKQKPATLNAKLCTLMENEADKRGVGLLHIPGHICNEILPAILAGWGLAGDSSDGDSEPKNEEPQPEMKEIGTGDA